VLPEWLDYNGHMTEHRYLQAFGESSDAFYGYLGVDFEHAEEGAYYTLETHIRHRAEAKVDTQLWSDTEILGYDEKRIHLYHQLFNSAGDLLATGEHLSIHVKGSAACPATHGMLTRVERVYNGRAKVVAPEGAGSVLRKALANSRLRQD